MNRGKFIVPKQFADAVNRKGILGCQGENFTEQPDGTLVCEATSYLFSENGFFEVALFDDGGDVMISGATPIAEPAQVEARNVVEPVNLQTAEAFHFQSIEQLKASVSQDLRNRTRGQTERNAELDRLAETRRARRLKRAQQP